MGAGTSISSNKRQRAQKVSTKATTQTLADQNGIYAAEKFSDSFSIGHVLNLLVESEDRYPHTRSYWLTHVCR